MANRLIHEKSPYLLQHAHNPVDWYPWGDEAFETARRMKKPVFLSVGYATCHWCHVMEKESFEDPEAAAALNAAFVCIKVDREERPDIDAVYMAVCQMVTGSGGWPLTITMTADRKPFFAGTYLPRESRFGRLGILDLCRQIQGLWRDDPQRVSDAADDITGHLGKAFEFKPSSKDLLDLTTLDEAYHRIAGGYDPEHGGFENAPKFPTAHRLTFLLRHHHRTGETDALEMVRHTLGAMRRGGLWDHVGYGFHRYATDRQWLLPHFEKMLYDQALLAIAYLEAYQVTAETLFARTAQEIFTYVLRDMTDPRGGFYTAEDADSDGEEGKFYVWTWKEFEDLVATDTTDIPWARIYNLQSDGNFTDEATRRKPGTNILHLTRTWEDWSRELDMSARQLEEQWDTLRERMFARRLERVAPLKDDKVLTDWNGMMIAALALGTRILGETRYAEDARKAVEFIFSRMVDGRGRLLHRFRQGQAAIGAQAGDYACLIMGLIELYRATFRTELLEEALRLQAEMDAEYWDHGQGGYFFTTAADLQLPVRPKEIYDGAMPSANSVALSNLILLGRLTGDARWERRAHQLTRTFGLTVARQPAAFTHFLSGLDLALCPGQEVVISGRDQSSDTRVLLEALGSSFAPHRVTHLKSETNARRLAHLAGFTQGLMPEQGRATAHICTGNRCHDSFTDVANMLARLVEK